MLTYSEPRLLGKVVMPALIAFFCLLGLIQVKDYATMAGNETSRLCVIQSVVDNGTFDITRSCFVTVDKAELNGKKYGDKPPLLTFLGIGMYGFLKHVGNLSFEHDAARVLYRLALTNLLFAAGCAMLIFFMLKRELPHAPLGYRLFASLMCVVSTLVFSYSVTVGNHVPCAFFLLLAMWHYQRCETRDALTLWDAFAGGVLAGTLLNCEFVLGGAAGIGFFLLTLQFNGTREERFRRAPAYAAGAALMIALEMAMNFISYGSVLPLYLLTHKPDMAGKNYLLYAFNVLFGFEGFFLYTPALLFIFAAKFKRGSRVRKVMLGICLLSMAIFLLSTSDYGGWSYGFRFFVPFAPVILYEIFVSWRTWRKGFLFALFLFTLLWGCVTAYVGTFNPWNASFEGQLTKKGTICERVRNSFLANLLAESVGNDPDSALSHFMLHEVYDPVTAWQYLTVEFWNRRDPVRYQEACEQYHREKEKRQ